MNRKTINTNFNLHYIQLTHTSNITCEKEHEVSDEEYHGNYTFIVIEDNRKKNKKGAFCGVLDIDNSYEEE
jgi:disulfide oxidoreductase YuzD